ncbi:hypothetical protein [Cesiribacter sp. SM1]|uniref:hypothetical protein n=1 Tax=Cesiribacter sp. SM1 TaxID=2861196 RepID=UPI001CD34F5B|nr:hypothetical protein [Cesiribacter sp. SM1]
MEIDLKAAAIADMEFWAKYPELSGRKLTLEPKDMTYREAWREIYQKRAHQMATPPPTFITPLSVDAPPRPKIANDPTLPCPTIAQMTHEEKMQVAIKQANLSEEVLEEIGDIKTLVASMVVVGGILALIAATGYGAVAEAVAAGLLIIGGALSGHQIGEGINSMMDFYQKTRCDKAKTPQDLADAGKNFGDGISKMGVGGLNLLLAAVGGRKASRKTESKPKPDIENAKWAQVDADNVFSKGGKFSNKSLNEIVAELKSGKLDPNELEIEVVVREGKMFILNTRSSFALTKAGIPRSKWNVKNKTGDSSPNGAEERLTKQLENPKNKKYLDSDGTDTIVIYPYDKTPK